MCFFWLVFTWSIIAASVVDFPDPVGPVTSTSPFSRSASVWTTSGSPSSWNDRICVGIDAEDGPLAVPLVEHVDAEPGHLADLDGEVEVAVLLEQPPLVVVQDLVDHPVDAVPGEGRSSMTVSSPLSRISGGDPAERCRSEPPRSFV